MTSTSSLPGDVAPLIHPRDLAGRPERAREESPNPQPLTKLFGRAESRAKSGL